MAPCPLVNVKFPVIFKATAVFAQIAVVGDTKVKDLIVPEVPIFTLPPVLVTYTLGTKVVPGFNVINPRVLPARYISVDPNVLLPRVNVLALVLVVSFMYIFGIVCVNPDSVILANVPFPVKYKDPDPLIVSLRKVAPVEVIEATFTLDEVVKLLGAPPGVVVKSPAVIVRTPHVKSESHVIWEILLIVTAPVESNTP